MKAATFSVRFQVSNAVMQPGQTAETTVRLKAPTVAAAIQVARARLAAKGWTVGACTDCRTKTTSFHVMGR
jgi:hypothetical protein